jgi:hypothetical protein
VIVPSEGGPTFGVHWLQRHGCIMLAFKFGANHLKFLVRMRGARPRNIITCHILTPHRPLPPPAHTQPLISSVAAKIWPTEIAEAKARGDIAPAFLAEVPSFGVGVVFRQHASDANQALKAVCDAAKAEMRRARTDTEGITTSAQPPPEVLPPNRQSGANRRRPRILRTAAPERAPTGR